MWLEYFMKKHRSTHVSHNSNTWVFFFGWVKNSQKSALCDCEHFAIASITSLYVIASTSSSERKNSQIYVIASISLLWVQGRENAWDAYSCRSLFAKEPLIIGLFCGNWPIKYGHPVGFRHTVSRLLKWLWIFCHQGKRIVSFMWFASILALYISWVARLQWLLILNWGTDCNTLQYTAIHCSTLQHTAAHCNALQHTAAHCNTLQHTATHTIVIVRQMSGKTAVIVDTQLSNTMEHITTHCNTHYRHGTSNE